MKERSLKTKRISRETFIKPMNWNFVHLATNLDGFNEWYDRNPSGSLHGFQTNTCFPPSVAMLPISMTYVHRLKSQDFAISMKIRYNGKLLLPKEEPAKGRSFRSSFGESIVPTMVIDKRTEADADI